MKLLTISEPSNESEWKAAFRGVLSHYHCCDQSAAGARFDTTVQGRTAVGPYGGSRGIDRMPSSFYVSAPLRGKSYGLITTVAFNPLYGDIDPARMAKLMVIEAISKAVVAGVEYGEIVVCDNFYTPRVRPDVAWDLNQMVETIADLSLAFGVPFISGKDSSSGTFETTSHDGQGSRRIDVPPTLVVAAMGRVPDVKKIVTKDFKRAGNKLCLIGRTAPEALGGSVYADASGQRGDSLFDPGDAASVRAVWDAVLELHRCGVYVSGSAFGEGGLALRLFEAAFGSGLGAKLYLDKLRASVTHATAGPAAGDQRMADTAGAWGRRDGYLFGEFIGSMVLEIPSDRSHDIGCGVPCQIFGEITSEPELTLADLDRTLWQEATATLAEYWSMTFREVVE